MESPENAQGSLARTRTYPGSSFRVITPENYVVWVVLVELELARKQIYKSAAGYYRNC